MTASHVTDDLFRMIPLQVARADTADGNILVGYAALFNEWTKIDSFWEGTFLERVAPGAFARTLKTRGDKIKVLFNHGFDPTIGDKPLGKPDVMREDETGLWTETPLSDTTYNADLKSLLRDGALDGMSFRFSVLAEEWEEREDDLDERTITEIKLYEFGPVTFPAYEATTAGVRSQQGFKAFAEGRIQVPDTGVTWITSGDGEPRSFTLNTAGATVAVAAPASSTPPDSPSNHLSQQERQHAYRQTAAALLTSDRSHHAREAEETPH